jgi:hypothetical protein
MPNRSSDLGFAWSGGPGSDRHGQLGRLGLLASLSAGQAAYCHYTVPSVCLAYGSVGKVKAASMYWRAR